MADNAREYAEIAVRATIQVTDSLPEWTAFLTTAGRLYKYPFEDQLLIYAQRPDAVACANLDVWNQKMRRYIRQNSTAIVLIDNSGTEPVLRYVFDFSDTEGGENARAPWLWQYRDNEHYDVISAALERELGKSQEDNMAARLDEISERLAREYWEYHREEIMEIIPGSFLEEYDEFNVEAAFCHAASVSISYTLMSRCNLEPDEYFQLTDFEHVFEFNTPAVIAVLGHAVSESGERVLRQIESTIRTYEREKQTERKRKYEHSTDICESGRLSGSEREIIWFRR